MVCACGKCLFFERAFFFQFIIKLFLRYVCIHMMAAVILATCYQLLTLLSCSSHHQGNHVVSSIYKNHNTGDLFTGCCHGERLSELLCYLCRVGCLLCARAGGCYSCAKLQDFKSCDSYKLINTSYRVSNHRHKYRRVPIVSASNSRL